MLQFLSDLRLRLFGRRFGGGPTVAVVRLFGPIGAVMPGRSGLTLAAVARDLEAAFKLPGVKTVALAINSPGGSPVQSNLIYGRVRALAEEHDVPVVAFVEDVAASGGYWLACAADEVYADPNSIVGSIGVISAGFGFPRLLDKIGVERRVYAQGERKGMLDAFEPENATDVKRLGEVQKSMYESFKSLVRERRGDKLQSTERKLFSGEFWTGSQALSLGLVDGLGDLRSVMRVRFGERVRLRLVNRPPGRLRVWLGRSRGAVPDSAGDWADGLLSALEARALWARFGL